MRVKSEPRYAFDLGRQKLPEVSWHRCSGIGRSSSTWKTAARTHESTLKLHVEIRTSSSYF
jgi:hypothetical protein